MKRQKSFQDWICAQQGVYPESALRYMLESLVPYSRANLQLTFRPSHFFADLERREKPNYARSSLSRAYYEAKRKGLILFDEDGWPRVSPVALQRLRPHVPRKLKGAQVLVVFDIPEIDRHKRQWFRLLLRELKFVQIQKSVWQSEYDCFEILSAAILEKRLEEYVRIFEARPVES